MPAVESLKSRHAPLGPAGSEVSTVRGFTVFTCNMILDLSACYGDQHSTDLNKFPTYFLVHRSGNHSHLVVFSTEWLIHHFGRTCGVCPLV